MQASSFANAGKASQQPLMSFIITDYNLSAEMLRECLNSILALSLSQEEREIILIDDGSEVSPIDELRDLRHLIIYIRQDNRGLSAARNTGLRMATGQYVQFVDGDDYLLRSAYEHCLDIVRYHDPDMVLFSSASKPVSETPFALNEPVTGALYMRNNNLRAAAWGYVFKANILGGLRFNESLLMHEDEEFTPQLMLRAERIFPTDAQAYFYRQRKGSITNSNSREHNEQRLHYVETVIFHLQDMLDSLPEQERIALNRRIAQLTMDYLYNIMRLTHSRATIEAAIERLTARGLFPLPDKDYTKKYQLFRKMVNNKSLRKLATTVMME